MRRSISTFVLTSMLVFFLSATPPASLARAQSKTDKTQKAAPPSLASQRGVDTITAAQLKDYLSFIASDEMEGRDTPSRGLDTTAKFLGMNLSRWGFKPAGDDGSYFQKIVLSRDLVDKAETRVQLNDQILAFGTDYIPTARPADLPATQLVFAGNGWFIKSKNIDAYKGIDAKGKIAVIFGPANGYPTGVKSSDLSGLRGEDWMNAAEYAQKQGVAGIVIVPDFQYLANWDRNRTRVTERGFIKVDKFQSPAGAQIPQIVLSLRVAEFLFQDERQTAQSISSRFMRALRRSRLR
jgi:hypothetical protein